MRSHIRVTITIILSAAIAKNDYLCETLFVVNANVVGLSPSPQHVAEDRDLVFRGSRQIRFEASGFSDASVSRKKTKLRRTQTTVRRDDSQTPLDADLLDGRGLRLLLKGHLDGA